MYIWQRVQLAMQCCRSELVHEMQPAGDAVANSNSSSSSAVDNSHIDVTGEASISRPHKVGMLQGEQYTTRSPVN